jgi:GT2 family glycosyltransferase
MSQIQKHPEVITQDAIFVSVIVVNWNGGSVLTKCLHSLRMQTYKAFELIVVDNGSTDQSWVGLENKWPGINLIRFSDNKGFAVANNMGARQASGEWIALLNSDAFPEPDWLEVLVDAVQLYTDFNFFSSTLIQADQPELLDGTGDVYHISGLAWRRDYNQPITRISKDVEEVFSPCAAAALYNQKAFLQVGGFDEDYFMYHEDVDLGFRLRLNRGKCLYVPDAVVHHLGSASTSIKSDFSIYQGHRNLIWSYFQNMPGWLFWKYLPAHILANLVFLIYYTFQGKAACIWRAKWHAILGLPRAIKKRRFIQKNRHISLQEISDVMERGWLKPYIQEFRTRTRVQK